VGGDVLRHAGAPASLGRRRRPFDIRPLGYSYEEARSFLAATGEQGRAYYLSRQLILDTVYPPFYAVSRALALW
jgi:hypothetical protein